MSIEDTDGPYFNLDAFIRDITALAPTITQIMQMDQRELSRLCLKRMREPEGRQDIEASAAALSDLSKRAHTFAGVAMQAWLFLQAELNDPGGAVRARDGGARDEDLRER